jgi:hypothetical protein
MLQDRSMLPSTPLALRTKMRTVSSTSSPWLRLPSTTCTSASGPRK